MKTNKRPNSDTRVDRQLRAGEAMYRGGYIAMIERQLAEARDEIARINKSLNNASAIYDAACEQRDKAVNDYESAQLLAARIGEQRDRLAKALEDILNDAPDSPLYKIKASREALAAVKGGQQ